MFGHFGYAGEAIVGDIGFEDPVSAQDWKSSTWKTGDFNWSDFSVFYTPLAPGVRQDADSQWARLTDLVDLGAPSGGRASARLNKLRSALVAPIRASDDISHARLYSNPQQVQIRAMHFNAINGLLSQFAYESWPEAADELATAAKEQQKAEAAAASFISQLPAALRPAQQVVQSQARQTQDVFAPAPAPGPGFPPAAVAALVAVPLVVIAYFALRKKSSVSGYRRRRRRR